MAKEHLFWFASEDDTYGGNRINEIKFAWPALVPEGAEMSRKSGIEADPW